MSHGLDAKRTYHRAMTYAATRRLILSAGLAVLLLISAVMFVRRVDTVEVVAVLLFIPIFLAFIFDRLRGGVIAGVLAAIVYAMLRAPAIEAIGAGRLSGIIGGRSIGYLAFGVLGGWAASQLERSVQKLELYDQIDDATGLFNARFLVQDTDLELARAGRYRTFFSLCMVEVPAAPLDALPRRKRDALLRDLGNQMREAVRTVDRAVHARDASVHRFAVVCPETAAEGADIFVRRLAERLREFLAARGVDTDASQLVQVSVTLPGDEERLATIREQFASIDRTEHPEQVASSAS